MRTQALVAASLLALSACANPLKPSPNIGPTAPTNPPALCQPTVKAPSRAEPLPPETGLAADILFDMLVSQFGEDRGKAWWEWFTTTYPNWAREGWIRIDTARGLPPCAP